MPRPKIRKETVIISLAVDRDLALKLREEARKRGLSVSLFAEGLLRDYLARSEGTGDLDPLANGGETASERRWRLLKMLDEPLLEQLPREVEALAKWVERLAQTPVSMRRTERFLSERTRARRKLIALKKEARRLLAAGYELEEGLVEKLVECERELYTL